MILIIITFVLYLIFNITMEYKAMLDKRTLSLFAGTLFGIGAIAVMMSIIGVCSWFMMHLLIFKV